MWAGDPDVAVAAADTAVQLYLDRADDVNADPARRSVHLPLFEMAARLAAVVHTAHGRDGLGRAAADLAAWAWANQAEAPRIGAVPPEADMAATVTVAEALDRAGATSLRRDLTAPAVDCRILMPLDRAAPQLAPAQAARLAELADGIIDHDRDAGLRLAMEAHGLFAGASELQVPAMRYQFGEWGPRWAAMCRRASRAAWDAGFGELAHDLAEWMAGALGQLGPHLVVDASAREVARRCLIWQGELAVADGDEEAAGQARTSLRLLDELDGA